MQAGETSSDVASLIDGSIQARRNGNVPRAELLARRAVALAKSMAAVDDALPASIELLAAVLRGAGRHDEALELYREALETSARRHGSDDTRTLDRKSNLGLALVRSGRYGEAAVLQRQVLEASRRVQGPRHPDTLVSANNLASVLDATGHHAEAEVLLLDAMDVALETLGATHPVTLGTRNNLASVLLATDRYGEAAVLYSAIRNVVVTELGEFHPHTLTVQANLASALESSGRYHESEALHRQTLEASRRLLGERHPDTLSTMHNLAYLLWRSGRVNEAETLFRATLQARAQSLGTIHPGTLATRHNLAGLLGSTGRLAEAEQLLRVTLSASEHAYSLRHPRTLTTAHQLIALLFARGRQDEGIALLERVAPASVAWAHAELDESRSGSRRMQLANDPLRYQSVVLTAALQTGSPRLLRLAAHTVLVWKRADGAAETRLARFASRNQHDPATAAAVRTLQHLRADLAAAVHRNAPDIWVRLEQLERARTSLAALSREYARAEREHTAGLDDVTAALPTGHALLEFRTFRPINFDTLQLAPARLAGVLIRNGEMPVLRDLGPVDEIDGDVGIAMAFDNWTQSRDAAARLARRLLEPFGDALGAASRIYVAPDGPVSLLSFDVLPFQDRKFWIQAQDVRFVSSGNALALQRRPSHATGMVALGGPDFDVAPAHADAEPPPSTMAADAPPISRDNSGPNRRRVTHNRFMPLPFAGAEADAVARMWQSITGETSTALVGARASEVALKALPRAPRVLHMATHGRYRASALKARVNPMTLSGLALAGANYATHVRTDGDDGMLWAIEAMGLTLAETELVVLSACDTARGVPDAAEGMYGLRRAFQIAGADNVLLTLWALNDARARRFMLDFYALWLLGGYDDPANALRATKLNWLRSGDASAHHPVAWAPYTMVQSGR